MKLEEFICQLEKMQNDTLKIETTIYGISSAYVIANSEEETREYAFVITNRQDFKRILNELTAFKDELIHSKSLEELLEFQNIKLVQNNHYSDDSSFLDESFDFFDDENQ